jgi:hypothetical protein
MQSPDSTSQIRIDLSEEQLAILLSNNIAMRHTSPEWPESVLIQSPVDISQIFIVLSLELLIILL